MIEEEKEAIERLDYFEPDDLVECAMYRDCVEKIKKLIEKQQKEIEQLKNLYSDEKIRNTIIKKYRDVIEKDYISKDKIKEKIKELESHIWRDGYMTKFDEYAIHYLKELLGE